MKILNIIALGLFFTFSSTLYGQQTSQPPASVKPDYDAALAKKVGADEFGMKIYVLAVLRKGTAKIEDTAAINKLMTGHMENINRLADAGKLVLAGPFEQDPDFRGIFIFNVTTVEEAKKLVESDPAIKAGVFNVDLRLWYGSAALMEISQIHKKIAEKNP